MISEQENIRRETFAKFNGLSSLIPTSTFL
jgi:hypothetical protein